MLNVAKIKCSSLLTDGLDEVERKLAAKSCAGVCVVVGLSAVAAVASVCAAAPPLVALENHVLHIQPSQVQTHESQEKIERENKRQPGIYKGVRD